MSGPATEGSVQQRVHRMSVGHDERLVVSSRPSVLRPCKSLSILYFSVFVVSDCAVGYFLFSEGEEIFFNSIFLGSERWKLFCKLWSVLGLVRLANVLTPVRWLVLITTFLPRFVLTNFHVHDSPAFSCPTHSKILLNG